MGWAQLAVMEPKKTARGPSTKRACAALIAKNGTGCRVINKERSVSKTYKLSQKSIKLGQRKQSKTYTKVTEGNPYNLKATKATNAAP